MPTWWDVTDFSKPEFKNIEVFYTTPFYISPTNLLFTQIIADYKTRFYSRPTDMLFRGYETVYHFAHVLRMHGKNMGSSLSDTRSKIFTDFDVQPATAAEGKTAAEDEFTFVVKHGTTEERFENVTGKAVSLAKSTTAGESV